MIYCTLGELLIKFNLTQKELAEATGIGANSIGRYCNNTWSRFDKDHLKKLCEYFDCEAGVLLQFYPVEEGVDESLMRNAIRYKLLQEEYSQFLPEESKKKLGLNSDK
ncbi:helix-turn-helix domain-containing protein [Clostridium cuniculi]|uniref:helix-turn-helix domain-containing protein n=1 Tax=Clostridium cuniculi TaxID=2548455 RepID=UPI001055BB5E|nr:helix-turn-helix transcriptional regulator [Clostridium cuniculi]